MTTLYPARFSGLKPSRFSPFVLGVLALVLNLAPAKAADYLWNGNVSTDWNTAANWTPRGVPDADDSAAVIADATVNTDVPVRVGRLLLAAGSSLQGAGDVTVVSGATFTDVKLSGSGMLHIEPGAIVDLNSVGRNNGIITNLLGTVLNTVLNLLISKRVVNRGLIRWNAGNLQLGADMTNEGSFDVRGSGSLTQGNLLRTTFTNNGIFLKSGIGAVEWTPAFRNKGTLRLTAGTLDLRGDSSQIAGLTQLEGGSLKSSNPFLLQGGKWGGSGTFTGNLRNEGGILAPGFSPGSIVINGSYTQAANGTLQAEIGGTTPGSGYDQLTVNGTATLGGTLDITPYGGFVPAAGSSFQLVKYFSVSGDFSATLNRFTNPGVYFSTSKTPSYLVAQTNADSGLPTITIAAPRINQASASVPTASGTSSDGLSGVASVSVRLYRYAASGVTDGYWDGSNWSNTYNAANHERPATGTTSWSWNLPGLSEGKYSLTATAKDKANNGVSTSVLFWIDTIVPGTLIITSPVHNAVVTSLSSITGSATDSGSGINSMALQIKRLSDNTYWTGSRWVKTATDLATQYSADKWSRVHSNATPMPSGSMLAAGTYQIKATATDRAGLRKSVIHTVSVSGGTTKSLSRALTDWQEASPLTVSMAEIKNNQIVLHCSMAPSAARPEHFTVLIEGKAVQLSKVSIRGTEVILHLDYAPDMGQPSTEHEVVVSWCLFDAKARMTKGEISITAH